MVELVLICAGTMPPHEFRKTFGDNGGEVPWDEVRKWLDSSEKRCDLHPSDQWYGGCDE